MASDDGAGAVLLHEGQPIADDMDELTGEMRAMRAQRAKAAALLAEAEAEHARKAEQLALYDQWKLPSVAFIKERILKIQHALQVKLLFGTDKPTAERWRECMLKVNCTQFSFAIAGLHALDRKEFVMAEEIGVSEKAVGRRRDGKTREVDAHLKQNLVKKIQDVTRLVKTDNPAEADLCFYVVTLTEGKQVKPDYHWVGKSTDGKWWSKEGYTTRHYLRLKAAVPPPTLEQYTRVQFFKRPALDKMEAWRKNAVKPVMGTMAGWRGDDVHGRRAGGWDELASGDDEDEDDDDKLARLRRTNARLLKEQRQLRAKLRRVQRLLGQAKGLGRE